MTRAAGWPPCDSNWTREQLTLASAARARLLASRALLDRRTASLEALSPVSILNRGYALVFDSSGAAR